MTAKSEFLRWSVTQAEQRVMDMALEFTDDPVMFSEAHSIEMPEESMSPESGFNFVMLVCCGVVAPDWQWQWSFENLELDNDTPYVWVRRAYYA